jgi:hypothetical protein
MSEKPVGIRRVAYWIGVVMLGVALGWWMHVLRRPDLADRLELEPGTPFVYAKVHRRPAEVPARFAAPIPARVNPSDADWEAAPPRAYVVDQICAGDPGMLRRLLEAIAAASDSGAGLDGLVETYSALAMCERPRFCSWSAERLVAEGANAPAPPVREVLWHIMAHCATDEYAGLFERADAPLSAVLEWFEWRRWSAMEVDQEADVPLDPLLVKTFEHAIRSGDAAMIDKAAYLVAADDTAPGAELLLRLHRDAPADDLRRRLALSMSNLSAPRARELFEAACAADSEAAECRRRRDLERLQADLGAQLGAHAGLVDEFGPRRIGNGAIGADDSDSLYRRILGAGTDGETDEAGISQALRRLAELDRARAIQAAWSLLKRKDLGGLARVLSMTLVHYPTPEALASRLRQLGMLDSSAPSDSQGEALLASEILEAGGRAYTFDTETGQFPNQHDSLARRLAELVEPELDQVLFEEVAPKIVVDDEGEVEDEGGNYTLHAYHDGQRLSVTVANFGDWYDVDAVLALINTLMRDRGSKRRLVALTSLDQTVTIVAGPIGGLRAAIAEGLLEPGQPGVVVSAGRAFDQKVADLLAR